MTFLDERTRKHFGYWYEQVAGKCLRSIPGGSVIAVHLHDPDIEIEHLHHQHMLYIGSARPEPVIALFPQRIEENSKDDTARFDLVINCLTKATNDILTWRTKTS